jgi:hypothetical protein
MIHHACQYLRFDDQHRNKPKGVSLPSDLPARRVVANPVPAFLAVPINVARCVSIPAFSVPAAGASENTPREVLHVGIDASAFGASLSGREPRIDLIDSPSSPVSLVRGERHQSGHTGVGDAQSQVRPHHAFDIQRRRSAQSVGRNQGDAGKPLTGHGKQIQRRKPRPHLQVCAFEGRSESGRELGVAGFALVVMLPAASHRWPDNAALGANRAVRPTHLF